MTRQYPEGTLAGRALKLLDTFSMVRPAQVAAALKMNKYMAARLLVRLTCAGHLRCRKARTEATPRLHSAYIRFVPEAPADTGPRCPYCQQTFPAAHGCPCAEAQAVQAARAYFPQVNP